jgi:hypothetical protein
VLGNDAACRGIFDRHLPAVEFDHLSSHLAMGGVESSLADDWSSGLNSGQLSLDRSGRCAETLYPNMRVGTGSTASALVAFLGLSVDWQFPVSSFRFLIFGSGHSLKAWG